VRTAAVVKVPRRPYESFEARARHGGAILDLPRLCTLDVNHGGSSGFGRKYRERLNGNWGIVDVAMSSPR